MLAIIALIIHRFFCFQVVVHAHLLRPVTSDTGYFLPVVKLEVARCYYLAKRGSHAAGDLYGGSA